MFEASFEKKKKKKNEFANPGLKWKTTNSFFESWFSVFFLDLSLEPNPMKKSSLGYPEIMLGIRLTTGLKLVLEEKEQK